VTSFQHRMGIICCLALVAGCAPRPENSNPRPAADESDQVATAAEQAIRDYAEGLARVARETADRVESFQSNAEVYDAVERASAVVHSSAFGPLAEAADKAVKPDRPYDKGAVKKLLESEGIGFQRAVSGKK
jgi:hypothetical protein